MTTEEVEELCKWSAPKLINTKRGWRNLRKAKPTDVFLAVWKDRGTRDILVSMGIQLGEKWKTTTGELECVWWQEPPKELVKKFAENLDNSRATDADILVPAPDGLAYMGYQKAGIAFARGKPGILFGDEMGLGKLHPVDTKILTPHGWKVIGELKIGDSVIGSNGFATKIKGVFPQGVKQSFRVRFSDGSSVQAGAEHLWTVAYWCGGKRLDELVLTTQQIQDRPKLTIKRGARESILDLAKTPLYLPMLSGPVHFQSTVEPPIKPYVMGLCLAHAYMQGDGICITVGTQDSQFTLDQIEGSGYGIGSAKPYGGAFRIGLPGFKNFIRELDLERLSGELFIPDIYKLACPQDRIDLLQGLMDSNGSVTRAKNRLTYHTTSFRLGADVQEIVESLGGIASVRTYDRIAEGKATEYQVRIRLPEWVKPFRLPRKVARYNPGRLASPCRTFIGVDYIRDADSVCISVEAEDHLYLTEHCILTHNTIEIIGVINDDPSIKKAIIVCPAKLKINWHRELTKWLIRPMNVAIVDTDRTFQTEADIWIINFEILHKYVDPEASFLVGVGHPNDYGAYAQAKWKMEGERGHRRRNYHKLVPHGALTFCVPHDRNLTQEEYWHVKQRPLNRLVDLVAVDEAHRIKDPKARQTVCTRAVFSRRKIAATGTPMLNELGEVFELANFCSPVEFPNKWKFMEAYGGARAKSVTENSPEGQKLQLRLRSTVMVRRLKRDVMKDLPPKRRQVIEIPHHEAAVSEEMATYRRYLPKFEALSAQVELAKVCNSETDYQTALKGLKEGLRVAFEDMAALRAETARVKIPYILDFVSDALADGRKIIHFAHHRSVIEAVFNKFRQVAVLHYGGLDQTTAQMSVDRFQNDDRCKLFSGSLKASGVGITLTAAQHEIFSEFDWCPAIMNQCEDRAHRIGATGEFLLIQLLVLEGSMDANLAYANVEKQNVADSLDAGREALSFDISAPTNSRHVHVNRAALADLAEKLSLTQIAAVHRGLQMLAGVCDGAAKRDDSGFNGVDARIGHSLAEQTYLSPRQAVLGQKIIRKYRRQLGEDLILAALGKEKEVAA